MVKLNQNMLEKLATAKVTVYHLHAIKNTILWMPPGFIVVTSAINTSKIVGIRRPFLVTRKHTAHYDPNLLALRDALPEAAAKAGISDIMNLQNEVVGK